jgi:lipopolysaccharide transport system ATP-binding protein
MWARLALAVVTDDRPDVLLLDEIFAVGDAEFQRRSRERILDLLHSGSTVMLVSHDLGTIEEWSSRVMWLDAGRVVAIGDPSAIVARYGEAMAHTT